MNTFLFYCCIYDLYVLINRILTTPKFVSIFKPTLRDEFKFSWLYKYIVQK